MRILLPANVECTVEVALKDTPCSLTMEIKEKDRVLSSAVLTHDAYPELRYLLILYFYNEYIPAEGKYPHPITLSEYCELYEAMFGIKCVYTDKNASIDHLRSHELYNRILKACGLRFVRGGLCALNKGVPDEAARELFRRELLACFREALNGNGLSIKAKNALQVRYDTLRGYTAQSPSKYLGIPQLLEQKLCLAGETVSLYRDDAPMDWTRLLQQHRRIFLSGISGSGKSTVLKCIALDPMIRAFYNKVIEKRLATQTHLCTRGELDDIEKYQGQRYLYLLDGFNELPHDDAVRTRVLNELARLSEYANVTIILSSTSGHGLWPGYTTAQLGSVTPGGELLGANTAILETPLLCNAYLASPRVTRNRLGDEYRVLAYAREMSFAAVIAKASTQDAPLVRLAYRALLPMLAEQMCLKDELSFDMEDVRALCERIKRPGTEENAMLRYCFESGAADLPDISLWSMEQMQNAFARLIESGEVKLSDKRFMLRHQRIRDYCAAEYELQKLRVLLSDESDRFILPHMKLCVSAQPLLRQALGVPDKPKAPTADSLLATLIRAVPQVEDSEQFTPTAIKLAGVYAEIYEYTQPLDARNLATTKEAQRILGRVTGWVCEYPDLSKALMAQMQEPGLEMLLAFVLCRQAELSMDYFHSQTSTPSCIRQCIRIVDQSALAISGYPRILHAKAKALMHASQLALNTGKTEHARQLLEESLRQLEDCYAQGSFLSGNLLAFLHRTPAPFLCLLKPELYDPQKGFFINLRTATDPALNGLSPTYARNEAVDALLTGEVSISQFPGLKGLQLMLQSPEDAAKVIGRGKGICGKKELKLARALMTARGGTLGDMRPMTVFYEFMIDWYEGAATGFEGQTLSQLRSKHMSRLKYRMSKAATLPEGLSMDMPFDLLALSLYDESAEERASCAMELCRRMAALAEKLCALASAKIDMTAGDCDHEFYISKKLLYYIRLLSARQQPDACAPRLSAAVDRLQKALEVFDAKYAMSKLGKNVPAK